MRFAMVLAAVVLVWGGFLALSALTGRTLLGAVAVAGVLVTAEPAWPPAALAVVVFAGMLAAVGLAERAALLARVRRLLGY